MFRTKQRQLFHVSNLTTTIVWCIKLSNDNCFMFRTEQRQLFCVFELSNDSWLMIQNERRQLFCVSILATTNVCVSNWSTAIVSCFELSTEKAYFVFRSEQRQLFRVSNWASEVNRILRILTFNCFVRSLKVIYHWIVNVISLPWSVKPAQIIKTYFPANKLIFHLSLPSSIPKLSSNFNIRVLLIFKSLALY